MNDSPDPPKANRRGIRLLGGILSFVALVGIIVTTDLFFRAKKAYFEGEKYLTWYEHPKKKNAYFEEEFMMKKADLDAKLGKNELTEMAYKQELRMMEFEKNFRLEESSLKYAAQWFYDAGHLFSPPDTKWVKLAREKYKTANELWKNELREKRSHLKARLSLKNTRFVGQSIERGFQTLFRWSVGLALLPLLWAICREFALMVPQIIKPGWRAWWMYGVGFLTYLLVERIFFRPMTLYVFGHELTHALSGILTGAQVHDFKVSSHGGHVKLSKSNTFIALSPYVVPLYALFLMAAYALAKIWVNHGYLTIAFQFLLGFTLAFHISMTFSAIHEKQPDLKAVGTFLSCVVIAIGNGLILGMFCVSLFKNTPTVKQFGKAIAGETIRLWKLGYDLGHDWVAHEWEVRNK